MKLRVALAQINPTVGDLAGNSAAILRWCHEAAVHAEGAHIILFPEMVLTGYPIEDLAIRASFQSATQKALDELVAHLPENIAAVS